MLQLYEDFLDVQFDEDIFIKYTGMSINDKYYTASNNLDYFLEQQKVYGSTNVIYIPELNFLINNKYGNSKDLIIVCDDDDINYENIDYLLRHQDLLKRFDKILKLKEEDLESHLFEQDSSKRSFILSSGMQVETLSLIISSGLSFCIFHDAEIKYKNKLLVNYIHEIDNTIDYDKFKKCFEMSYNKQSLLSEIIDKIRDNMKMKYKYFQDVYSHDCESIDVNFFDDSVSFFYQIRNQDDNLHKTIFYKKFLQRLKYSDTGIFLDHEVCYSFLVEERCYLYPWIGILEVIDDEDINYLMNSERFRMSLEFNIVLFVFTENIMNTIHSINTPNLNIQVLNIFNNPSRFYEQKRFNLENFKARSLVINVGRKINREMLNIFSTHKKRDMKQQHITEETFLDSITVISSTHPSPIGIFYDCVILGKPVVLRRNEYFETILGDDYPLFSENCYKKSILDILTIDNIIFAHNRLNNILNSIVYNKEDDIGEFFNCV